MSRSDASLQSASEQIARAQKNRVLRPSIAGFFDEATNTVSYMVHDPATSEAAILDSVLDYEAVSGRTSQGSANPRNAIRETPNYWCRIMGLGTLVYTLGIPVLRTPVYLVSWAASLMIGAQVVL